jgi:hypothetical protein
MNVEIGAEAAQFPEKEYINGIAVAVCAYSSKLLAYLKKPDILCFVSVYSTVHVGKLLVHSKHALTNRKCTQRML